MAPALFAVSLFAAACGSNPPSSSTTASGGDLLVTVRSEPQSFNGLAKRDSTTQLVSALTQARLVRVNAATQELEPWLAEKWTSTADGRRYTVTLRPNLTFSDGVPLTS